MKKTANRKAIKREETFPSSSELIVASALLLLSSTITTTTSPPTNSRKTSKTSSRSCSNAENVFQNSVEMAPDSQTRKLKSIATFVTRFHQLKKLKVMRKKRSQTSWIYSKSEAISSYKRAEKPVSPSGSGSTSAVSCLTNSFLAEFSEQSNVGLEKAASSPKRKLDKVSKGDTRNRIGSGHIRRRAEGILKVLATSGPASEVRIRDILGNSPDTSKALRILLKRGQIKRRGAGGRVDPYTYSIA